MKVLFRRFGYYLLFVCLLHIQQFECENATEVSNDTLRDVLPNKKLVDKFRSATYDYEKHDAVSKRDLKDFDAPDKILKTLPFDRKSDNLYMINDKDWLPHNSVIDKSSKRAGNIEVYPHKFFKEPMNLYPYSAEDKEMTNSMQRPQPKFDDMNSFREILTVLPTELRIDKIVNNWLPVYRPLMRSEERAGKVDAVVNLDDKLQMQSNLKNDLKGALNNNGINSFEVTPVTPRHFLSFKSMELNYPSNAKGNDRKDNSLRNGQPIAYKEQNSFTHGEQQKPVRLSQRTANDLDRNTKSLKSFHSNKEPRNITEIESLKISRNIVPASSTILDSIFAEDPSVKFVEKVGKENYELRTDDAKLNSFLKLPSVKSPTVYFFDPQSSSKDNPESNKTNFRKMAVKKDIDKSNYVLRNLNISNEFKAVVAFKDYPSKFHKEFVHFNFASNESTESSNNIQKLYSRFNDINSFQNLRSVFQFDPVVNNFSKIRLQNLRLPNRIRYLHKKFGIVTNFKGKPHIHGTVRENLKNTEDNDIDSNLPFNSIADDKIQDLKDRKIHYLGPSKDSNRKENLESFQTNSYGMQNSLHYSSQNQPFLSSHPKRSNLNNMPIAYSYTKPKDIGNFKYVSNNTISFISLPENIKSIFKENLSSKPVAVPAGESFEPINKADHFDSNSGIPHDKIDTMSLGRYFADPHVKHPVSDDHAIGHLGNTKKVPRDETSGESESRGNKLAMGKLSYIANNKIYNKASLSTYALLLCDSYSRFYLNFLLLSSHSFT
ncbi:uncharacterized protein LOC118183822 isoform X2 [Stegodyphus dumicola]|uniref:uncharacterized protein LOC118183822 isoform X2 n=1 Tax=Stegodyphus dumicola TaxID=202533 RepID=UPI0015A8CD0C|nr:uncharacterized protein LOC118183822 isoform X2 [Stegodyphus dumicola]